MTVERATWVLAHDRFTNVVHELELRTSNIQARRAVEQDGLDAIVEGHARLHVEDDRDRDALGLGAILGSSSAIVRDA